MTKKYRSATLKKKRTKKYRSNSKKTKRGLISAGATLTKRAKNYRNNSNTKKD